ncbi:branched-chain amino acid ABC transporter permease [Azospirillum sp. INR13]|uniref:branched-chain amino acid ABC transporter permease n=1 Tax=Azospirillum sp. INR13 TaxID=2596919 RepID=UPI00189270AE|nr:branched-chain amino acid ABC transporter permease [Azospirillum sp. INR13]MBF5096523.1 branched-chain amino acid ABC transporter permease [Azospirillum sp. INR13]
MDLAILQFLSSGITEGARYALAALGFTIIFNASGVINFAQGESIMLGGLISAILVQAGWSLPVAILAAVLCATLASILLQKISLRVLQRSGILTVIVLTVAFGMVVRGTVRAAAGTSTMTLPHFSSAQPLSLMGATILPQTLWVIVTALLVLAILGWFFECSRMGRAFMATASNAITAQLMGINTKMVLLLAFTISGIVGAVAGAVTAPITYTSFDAGVMVGLKAVIGAILGGMGSIPGAVVGGFLLGIAEALTAGYVSSAYKDAVSFLMVVLVFLVRPNGLFGRPAVERV